MTHNTDKTELDLEAFFASEMASGEQPSDALLAAVLRDAQDLQPDLAGLPKASVRPWSWKLDFWDTLGGWGAASTLSACLIVGVALGYTTPGNLGDITDKVLETAGISVDESYYFTLDDMTAEG